MPSSLRLDDPERDGAANDGNHWQRPEIPSIERVRHGAIEEKDFVGRKLAAALPDGQRLAGAIMRQRGCDGDSIDHDDEPATADDLTRQRRDMLEQGHAAWQIAALGKEGRERWGGE